MVVNVFSFFFEIREKIVDSSIISSDNFFSSGFIVRLLRAGQGRKTADWLPFSRQFVLSADHLTTNQEVYKKEQSLKPNT